MQIAECKDTHFFSYISNNFELTFFFTPKYTKDNFSWLLTSVVCKSRQQTLKQAIKTTHQKHCKQ